MKQNKFLRGFTFIELMMALLIFSIIAVSLYSTFGMASSAWRRTGDANRIYREAKFSLDEISRSLKNAEFFDFSKSYPDLKLFDGQADKISFFIATGSGLKKISYSLEKPDFGSIHKVIIGKSGKLPSRILDNYKQIAQRLLTLQEKRQDFAQSVSGQDAGVETIALTSLAKEASLKFSFAYKSGESELIESLIWKDSFESPIQLPKLVKVSFTLINPKNLKQEKTFSQVVYIPSGEIPSSE